MPSTCRVFTTTDWLISDENEHLVYYTKPTDSILLGRGVSYVGGGFDTVAEPMALADILDFVRSIAARDKSDLDNPTDVNAADYNTLIDIARQYVKVIGE